MEEQRIISKEEALLFKSENELDLFVEASGETGKNATNTFIEAAKLLYYHHFKLRHNKILEKINNRKKTRNKKTQNGNNCIFI